MVSTCLVTLLNLSLSQIPGGCSQSSDECLQQPSNENEGVLLGDDKVQCRQDNGGMDEQAGNYCDCVHSQLATHSCEVIHLHNLTSNQKQDTNWGIPGDQRMLL